MSNLNIEKVLKILQKNKLIYTLVGILIAFIILNTQLKEHFTNLKSEVSGEKLADLDGKVVDQKSKLEKQSKKDLYTLLETGDEYLKYRILHSFIEMMEHRPTGGGLLPIDLYLWKFINDGDMKKIIDSLPGESGSSGW